MCKALDNIPLGPALLVSHWVISLGPGLVVIHWVITLGHGLGVRHRTKITGSWYMGKALDCILLGRGLGVRHWTTYHWVVV